MKYPLEPKVVSIVPFELSRTTPPVPGLGGEKPRMI
jgi:hypothetical protein